MWESNLAYSAASLNWKGHFLIELIKIKCKTQDNSIIYFNDSKISINLPK